MTYSLRILPAADADVDSAAAYIARNNMDAALRFFDPVDHTYGELCEHPDRWPIFELTHPRLMGLRKRAVFGFAKYLVFYRVERRVVEIIRVLHGARDIPTILSEP